MEDLRPGLVAVYRSKVDNAVLTRVDAKPAFTVGHSSPHPRLAPGTFEVTWTGVLFLKEKAPISFHAFVGGEVTVDVDGVIVLDGRGESDTAHIDHKTTLNRAPGLYRLKVHYRALANVPARLQIGWQGPGFAPEPLPAWQLMHLTAEEPAAVREENLAALGPPRLDGLAAHVAIRMLFPGSANRRRGRPWQMWAAASAGPGCSAGSNIRRRSVPVLTCRPCSPRTGSGLPSAG